MDATNVMGNGKPLPTTQTTIHQLKTKTTDEVKKKP